MGTRIIKGSFWEDTPIRLQAEWPMSDGVLWQTSDFTNGVALRIFDKSLSNSSTPVYSTNRVIGNVLTNTPGDWIYSDTGPNFHDVVTNGEITNMVGGHSYRVEYGFTLDNGQGVERLVFLGRAKSIDSA